MVLQLCAAGELRCSEKTLRPSAATLSTVVSQLARGDFYLDDPIASFAWPLLVQAGGLAKIEDGRLQLTAKGRTALRRPPAEVIRAVVATLADPRGDRRVQPDRQIKGQRARNVLTSASTRRQTVARAWPAAHPESGSAWIPCSRPCDGKRLSPTDRPQRDGAVEALPRRLPLWVLGYDGLQAIRLTILGRYALGLTDTYQARTRDEETRS